MAGDRDLDRRHRVGGPVDQYLDNVDVLTDPRRVRRIAAAVQAD